MAIEKIQAQSSPVIGEDVPVYIEAKDYRGNPYDLSGTDKIYLTVKSDLAATDGGAEIQLDTTSDAGQFDLTRASAGKVTITIPDTDTDGLDADTVYFLDVKAIWSSDIKYIIRAAEVRFKEWVTNSNS